MTSANLWLMLIDQWEATVTSLVRTSQTAFQHEKYSLQLHVETTPIPFRPSTVLSQLIQSEQRRGNSTKQQRIRTKNAEYLERKLESEVRHHYELESAQTCDKWKRLHASLMDDRRQLQERIEWDARQLSDSLSVKLTLEDSVPVEACNQDGDEAIEAERQRQLVESEWIHQERFNIQEAFTNQTKKIQADYQAFIEQLDAEFTAERQKILSQTHGRETPTVVAPTKNISQFDKQFKSNAKRHMLVQTAPVVDVSGSTPSREFLTTASRNGSNKNDLTMQDSQLQELEHRLAAFKEAAEDRLKDGMQWIARQCAHMFSQLDSKEAEAKLVHMVAQQNDDSAAQLVVRIQSIASQLQTEINAQSGRLLPAPTVALAPSKTSERRPRRRSEPVGLHGARKQTH